MKYKRGDLVIFLGDKYTSEIGEKVESYTIGNTYELGGTYYKGDYDQEFHTVFDDNGKPNGCVSYRFKLADILSNIEIW
jgi:hypothetical protein